jgi:glycine cleavage system H protein
MGEQAVTPDQLRYTKTHEWVHVENDASGAPIATVGITDFAVQALTDLVFLELPPVGREVTAGEPFGEVESVKAVNDLYSPVDGVIVESNTDLANNLDRLSTDAFGAGWLIKVKLDNELPDDLMDYAAYKKQCEESAD